MAPIDEAALAAAFEKLTTDSTTDDLVALVKASGPAVIATDVLKSLDAASTQKKKNNAREGAAAGFLALVQATGREAEPFLVAACEPILALCGDRVKSVAEKAVEAMKALVGKLSTFGVRALLPHLYAAGLRSQQWGAVVAGLDILCTLTETAPRQVAACLPTIIPEVSDCMTNMKAEVVEKSKSTMTQVCTVVGNMDIEPFIPTLIECITNIDEVPECVHKLAATTFVQTVESPTLSIMGPLLQRGLDRTQKVAIKRKSAVIIDNMCKLVEDPTDAAPFLPKLLPGLNKLVEEVADPECRQVASRAHRTLLRAAGTTAAAAEAAAEADEEDTSKMVDEATIVEEIKACIAAAAPKDAATMETLAPVLAYMGANCANAIESKNFEFGDWKAGAISCYLVGSTFFSEAEADKITQAYVDQARAAHEAKKVVYVDDEEEGEDLCKCDFSLAYGAMILLNNASLHLKKGKRYGLCGPNGCGKSTLMKAIAKGQVEGFPPPDELRTVYVEHDIQADQTEMSVVEFVLDEPRIKADGTPEEEVRTVLTSLEFTDEMQNGLVTALSGGWKMKLALARAMLQKAEILLLDEPTNHLDVKNVKWLEDYLCSQTTVSSMIVSHDSGFLDHVCTHIVHYETRKLKTYKGNLVEFVKQCPEAKSYYELANDNLKFTFPAPGYLEGVKNKDKAIVKANNVWFKYPKTERWIIQNATIQLSLSSRVACLGPNGAGKSTFIKVLTGEAEATQGTVWKHQNMRFAYVAQHAFHHVEQHLDKTPNEYIQWRFSGGEDKENLTKVTAQYTPEEEKKMKEKIPITLEDGTIEKRVLEKIMGRREKKKSYEYEVKWENKAQDYNTWMARDKLEQLGFTKYLMRIDEKEAARAGLYARPLTQKNVEVHLEDFGLDREFGTHNRVKGLSGGQKVKVVIAAAMWNQPHVLVLDEPTNYLDRDALGALALAIQDFGGGVLMITHNNEFCDAICKETWTVGGGVVDITGNLWGQGKSSKGEKIEFKQEEETIDALGNTIKVKQQKRSLSRKEIKARAKLRKGKIDRGEYPSDDSDWEEDNYIGVVAGEAEKAAKAAEKEAKKAAKKAEK